MSRKQVGTFGGGMEGRKQVVESRLRGDDGNVMETVVHCEVV